MSDVDVLFARLRSEGRKALLPFISAGDPDIETTAAIIRTLAEAGADMCEVGVPYSDPIADGPVIQASYQRALESGFRLSQLFELGESLRSGSPQPPLSLPMVTMVSYSIMLRTGIEAYVRRAVAAGYSGAIVPDLLVEEADEAARICRAHDFSLVQLVTPTTPRDRQLRIAELSSGFLYVVSVTGITGERRELPPSLLENVGWLREQTELPICIGFGISGPEQVRQLAPVADGLIVGSAFVRRIAAAHDGRAAMLEDVKAFAEELIQAMREPVGLASKRTQ
ncbi:tryptophan synthase subunit alpha [Candidatus Laterigemmans baculatus]|uniref:tryptophan synthase subunit alpha n=1 Tax=Candidatus Laterigemmans baculatus TaxID=2770505 RepID=UPI0013DA4A38|nr:tryptophan synthase subunit alpha [Candidatus Laterigemmans baculatus]